LLFGIDGQEAAHYFRLSANQGYGLCFLLGAEVPFTRVKAVKHFRLAAEKRDRSVYLALGISSFYNVECSIHITDPEEWFKLLACFGSIQGQFNYGLLASEYLPDAMSHSSRYFAYTADPGLGSAEVNYGVLLFERRSGPVDFAGWAGTSPNS
jgi:TPR repeat protein